MLDALVLPDSAACRQNGVCVGRTRRVAVPRRLGFAATVLAVSLLAAVQPAPAGAAVDQSWNPPVTVSPSAVEAQAAIDAHGDLAVVWNGNPGPIELSTRLAGGSFSAPVTITETPEGHNKSPAVALGPEGQVIVVWTTDVDEGPLVRELVMASTGSITGGAFSPPEPISGYEGGNGWMYPRVAITAAGEAIAMWKGLATSDIHYAERPPGGAHFAAPQTIGTEPGVLAFSPGGTALAVWWEGNETVAAVKPPGSPFDTPETIAPAKQCSRLQAAINDVGDAVIAWTVSPVCGGGQEPNSLQAVYRPAGRHFGPLVDVAQISGWADVGGVAVSPQGRVAISASGHILSPASPSPVTTFTRLPDGTYGTPETISNQAVDEPPVLAFDAEGNLYAAAETRNYWQHDESGVLANVAPAGGTFAPESQWLQILPEEFERLPSLVAAGEGQAAAMWTAGPDRVELATLAPAKAAPSETPPAGASPTGGVAGSLSQHAATPHTQVTCDAASPSQLTVTGRAKGARSILVRLLRGNRIVRSCNARLASGHFRALLSLGGLPLGRYRVQIVRRTRRWHRSEYRSLRLTRLDRASYTSG